MKASLKPGLSHVFEYRVPPNKTVPHIYTEAADFQHMPDVFATGFMVALCEWAAVDLLRTHLDWPREQSLGIHVNLSHEAPTLPGMTVRVECTLVKIDGRVLSFDMAAHDGIDCISKGSHQRAVIDQARFQDRLEKKRLAAGV